MPDIPVAGGLSSGTVSGGLSVSAGVGGPTSAVFLVVELVSLVVGQRDVVCMDAGAIYGHW